MDTLRVDICYRPIRIAWVIKSDDFDAFRQAVRCSYALWGGKFSPIIFADFEDEAGRLMDLFRVDVIITIGDDKLVKEFPKKYPHIINPFYGDFIFSKEDKNSRPSSAVLDIHNALVHFRDKPEWQEIKEFGIKLYTWSKDDPLSDVFLSQLGAYPSKDEVGIDYLDMFKSASGCDEISLSADEPVPAITIEHPSISSLSRFGIKRHHGIDRGWKAPGFFVGSVSCLGDLVCHWNLRACDIHLWFIDPKYIERYVEIIPIWEKVMREEVSNYRNEWDRRIAVWTRNEDLDEACKPLGDMKLLRCRVADGTWNGLNVRAPMMHFGEISALGIVSNEDNKTKVSFALSDKPFCSDKWFFQQHLVASVNFIGGLYGDEQNTFDAPYLPELNEFYARTMHFHYDRVRVEPERLGIIIDAADHDTFLYSLPVMDLMVQIFDMAGYEARLSNAGLIAKQLIAKLDGIQGGRIFKIPGVRRLIKTHGPNATLTKRAALQIIGSKDPERSEAKFNNHENLYIETRPIGTKLTPDLVFGYMVEKGVFRIGADLSCPSCKINSWTPLDSLRHKVVCELCGHEYDVSRMLADINEYHYRRSGILGVEKNAQGAIPVLLTLQQLDSEFHGGLRDGVYSLSLDLKPKDGVEGAKCEVDFIWVIPQPYPRKTVILLAECKDKGPITEDDVSNLKRIADALPRKRFKTFIILSQIAPFTVDEIEIAKSLNDKHRCRAILLTANELEPYHIGEKTKGKDGKKLNWYSPEEMASSTAQLYFIQEEGKVISDEGQID